MELNNFQVAYALTNVDVVERTATLKVSQNNGPLMTLQVSVSRLIASLVQKQREGQTKTVYENNTFISRRYDPIFNHNPFSLVKFIDADGNFINFNVQHVKEAGKYRKAMRDSFGRRLYVSGYKYRSSTEFNRYVERKVKNQ